MTGKGCWPTKSSKAISVCIVNTTHPMLGVAFLPLCLATPIVLKFDLRYFGACIAVDTWIRRLTECQKLDRGCTQEQSSGS